MPEPMQCCNGEAGSVLAEATKIVHGARRTTYGHPLDNHGCTADLWTAYLRRKTGLDLVISPEDVCWLNILQKVSRQAHLPTEDNLVDAIGYVVNVEMIGQERDARIARAGIEP